MNRLTLLIATLVLAGTAPAFSAEKTDAKINQLSAKEKKAGWKLLFDGKSLDGWRGYKKPDAPKQGWVIENDCLKHVAKAGGGDIVTIEKFTDYDLRWEWRLPAGANNGVKYLVSEDRSAPGPEYQMIDDASEATTKQQTAALYDIFPPSKDKPLKPVGEWNASRVLVKGNHVEHWLNGKNVLSYELSSPELKAAIAQSKFKDIKNFGEKIKGHILLTDHHDEASFRNVKILEFTGK